MTKKALTLALEALEKERPYLGAMPALTSKAITAIKEALSELEQDDEVLGFNGWGFPIEKPSQPEHDLYDEVFIAYGLPQPEQEPVAIVDSTISGHIDWLCTFFPKQGTKLYTTPPQRTWVGLTKQEIRNILESNDWTTIPARLIWKAEEMLKEKNT